MALCDSDCTPFRQSYRLIDSVESCCRIWCFDDLPHEGLSQSLSSSSSSPSSSTKHQTPNTHSRTHTHRQNPPKDQTDSVYRNAGADKCVTTNLLGYAKVVASVSQLWTQSERGRERGRERGGGGDRERERVLIDTCLIRLLLREI